MGPVAVDCPRRCRRCRSELRRVLRAQGDDEITREGEVVADGPTAISRPWIGRWLSGCPWRRSTPGRFRSRDRAPRRASAIALDANCLRMMILGRGAAGRDGLDQVAVGAIGRQVSVLAVVVIVMRSERVTSLAVGETGRWAWVSSWGEGCEGTGTREGTEES